MRGRVVRRGNGHGAKFEYGKIFFAPSHSFLPEQNRAGGVDFYYYRHYKHGKRENYYRQSRYQNIHESFEKVFVHTYLVLRNIGCSRFARIKTCLLSAFYRIITHLRAFFKYFIAKASFVNHIR